MLTSLYFWLPPLIICLLYYAILYCGYKYEKELKKQQEQQRIQDLQEYIDKERKRLRKIIETEY